jgi:endonuclease/exonuclease/phosphatase family metal-dependent hydrolase
MAAWLEFPWQTDLDDDPLCAEGASPTDIECHLEGADFTSGSPVPGRDLVVCAYNVERGLQLDGQLRAFTHDTGMPAPDVLLLSEADRGCTRSGDRNIAAEYARALGMRYVYGVEFVELPRFWGPGGAIRERCEHGNAIVTRYPLGNVRLIRHTRTRSWHSRVQRALRVGQPRRGGRVAVAADLRLGDHLLRLYAVHFESGRSRTRSRDRDAYRLAQAGELICDSAGVDHGVLIGGDMNVLGFVPTSTEGAATEPTVEALMDAGFLDAHASVSPDDRVTTDTGRTIDLIVGRGLEFIDAGVGRRGVWGDLSDHLPVWARVSLQGSRR